METNKDGAAAESDARLERMDRVAVLFGEITAATREFLRALAESDRCRDWAEEGFGSCAEWLAWRVGIGRNAANEKVRAAHALEGLPLISEGTDRRGRLVGPGRDLVQQGTRAHAGGEPGQRIRVVGAGACRLGGEGTDRRRRLVGAGGPGVENA